MKTVLLIDDEADILDILSDVMDMMGTGLKILKASSVGEAQSIIHLCDAVISDVNMPLKDQLEEMLLSCGKPVCRITGHDDYCSEIMIPKPFSDQQIEDALNKLRVLCKQKQVA